MNSTETMSQCDCPPGEHFAIVHVSDGLEFDYAAQHL